MDFKYYRKNEFGDGWILFNLIRCDCGELCEDVNAILCVSLEREIQLKGIRRNDTYYRELYPEGCEKCVLA